MLFAQQSRQMKYSQERYNMIIERMAKEAIEEQREESL